jgi:glutamate-ammonia-ligase adenylyltransferase
MAWAETCKRFSIKASTPHGLFILGLGKLGGNDLNFSSDIDLVAFYDADILPVSANKGQAYISNQCLKTLTQILTPRNSPDHIWRVDWRLRPESSGTGLALSTAKAEKFYFFRALPWHRLALMKARIVAGDKTAGLTFLQSLNPFIWPQNLDFRALDDLADLKTRINNEHPGLSYERQQLKPIIKNPEGFNLKLGAGGIREIEFIANAQQLVWGGKQTELRQTSTLDALKTLAKLGHMSAEDAENLSQSYMVLRRVENARQMMRNEQTHMVPNDEADKARLLSLSGYDADHDGWEIFCEDILKIRRFVNSRFKSLFEADDARTTSSPSFHPDTPSPLAEAIIKSWENGFDTHGLPSSSRAEYRALGRRLLARVIDSQADTEIALQNIDRFLKSISRSAQYFDLLNRHDGLLDTLITPLLHSPHMTALLEQSPHIIDIFLLPQSVDKPDPSAILADKDYGMRLDRLRRFVNEHLFLYYHRFMEKSDGLQVLQHNLTRLAEICLDTAIQIVMEELETDCPRMAVMGLGKMGTRTMAPKSDLDLVFIFDDSVDSELAAQIVRRLKTTLMTPLREGIAYELDMRLRPSGRSGPPAVKHASFQNHHNNRAHNWEHIALAHSRAVSGDAKFGAKISAFCEDVVNRPRDTTQFLTDAKVMWSRIEDQRILNTPHSVCNAKLRPGGLMQAQYIQACHIVLNITPPDDLEAAIAFWQYQQIWERLLGLKQKSFDTVAERFREKVFFEGRRAIDQETYINKSEHHADCVIGHTAKLFEGTDTPADDTSFPVNWASDN